MGICLLTLIVCLLILVVCLLTADVCLLTMGISLLTLIVCLLAAGVCGCRQRSGDQDGRQQPGDGDGTQRAALPVRRPQGHLREHAQRNGVPQNADPEPGHYLHGRRRVDDICLQTGVIY